MSSSNSDEKTNKKRNILCLGVSYPDLPRLLRQDETLNDTISPNVAMDCVEDGTLTQMDGRDLARCLATEQQPSEKGNIHVYTVSREQASLYRPDRHMDANFNRPTRFIQQLQTLPTVTSFDQIVLDWFWIPAGWDDSHWSPNFFRQTLPRLAPFLEQASTSSAIYLPFCWHCFQQTIGAFADHLQPHFDISFVRRHELSEIAFWAGTQTIDASRMQQVLGKQLDQEERYCTFGLHHVQAAEASASVTKQTLLNVLNRLSDFDEIRFLKLTPVSPGGGRGRILGLEPLPTMVRNGIGSKRRQGATKQASCGKRRTSHVVTPDARETACRKNDNEEPSPARPKKLFLV